MSLKREGDLNPTSKSTLSRAKSAAQSKNYEYAITLLQSILKEEPLFLDGRRLLRAVEIQKFKAMSSFAKQMQNVKLASMAKMVGTKKVPQEQLIQAEEILAQDPYNFKANALLGDAGMALGYPEFKCFAYETLREGKPNDKAILLALGDAYMASKESAKAVKVYENIIESFPADGEALSALKNALAADTHKEGKWEEAEKAGDFRTSLKDEGEAKQLEQEGKVVKSADAIQEQIEVFYGRHQADPKNPNHPKEIAKLFEQRNDYGSAAQWYQYAFDVGGGMDSSLEKTVGDLKLKKVEQELSAIKEQLTTETDPDALAQVQAALVEKEKESNDVRLFQAEARVRAQPNEGEFRYDLGVALYKIGQYKRATEELQLSLKQPSVRYSALNLMGQAFMKRNMMDFAIKQLVLAQSELPSMDEIKKEISYNLGLAYEVAKQPEKSLDQWKMIYEYDMTYRDVAARVEASYGGEQSA